MKSVGFHPKRIMSVNSAPTLPDSLSPDLNLTTVMNFTLLQQSKQKAIMRRSAGPWLQLGFQSSRGKQSTDVLH